MSELVKVEKVLRTLTPRFDYIVFVLAMGKLKDPVAMKIEDIHTSLKGNANELRMKRRNLEKVIG